MTPDGDNTRVLRGYLLGSLGPESRRIIEQRVLSDDRIFWERLSLVEDELIDEYVAGDLATKDTRRFESHFLCTERRHAKLDFARALKEYVESVMTGEVPDYEILSEGRGFWHWLRAPLPAPAWAVAAAMAVLVLMLPIVLWQSAQSPRGAEEGLWLRPGLVRGQGAELERVRISTGNLLIQLLLELESAEHASYSVALYETATDDEIWTQSKLGALAFGERIAIRLVLPAEILVPADYYARVTGVTVSGGTEMLHRYDFRVPLE